jgi:D-glycero-D-manno-heptose 1,7-bisphosphate phosphatase
MDKIVFLDRDGTINKEVKYLHKPEELILLSGASDALKRLKMHGFKLVVVTNQAGVARGYYTEEQVVLLHKYLNELLIKEGAGIDHFFYCPHHPEHGIGEYKKRCHCRKPETGMFEMAEEYYRVDKEHSFLIGDKLTDTVAGKRYGVNSILVGTGYGEELYHSIAEEQKKESFDYYAETLHEAVDYIVN